MFNVYYPLAHFFCSFHLFLSSSVSALEFVSASTESSSLKFPLHNEVTATDVTPNQWTFYFQGLGLPLSFNGTW